MSALLSLSAVAQHLKAVAQSLTPGTSKNNDTQGTFSLPKLHLLNVALKHGPSSLLEDRRIAF